MTHLRCCRDWILRLQPQPKSKVPVLTPPPPSRQIPPAQFALLVRLLDQVLVGLPPPQDGVGHGEDPADKANEQGED